MSSDFMIAIKKLALLNASYFLLKYKNNNVTLGISVGSSFSNKFLK